MQRPAPIRSIAFVTAQQSMFGYAHGYLTARWSLALLSLLIVFPFGGATCSPRKSIPDFAPPVVFEKPPTLENVVQQLNKYQAVERLNSSSITLTSPDMSGSLKGNLSWHRAMDFRLQAYPGTRLLGNVIDAGSNSDAFWLQTGAGGPPTLYYARHDEFEMQTAPRRILPVSPLWIREALGIVEFDPNLPHEGPIERADGKYEIRSLIPSPRGNYRRFVVIEPKHATVRELWLEDPSGKMVARAFQSQHQYYNAIDATLPHRVDLQLIAGDGEKISMAIEVYSYTVNQVNGDETLRYTMPDPTGMSVVDLVKANAQMQPPAPVAPAQAPHTAFQYNDLQRFR